MADAQALFWEKKLAENQHLLDLIDAGQCMAGDGGVIDAETIAEMRTWAARRVAECAARIDARATLGGHS
jgi:hypothetical protein